MSLRAFRYNYSGTSSSTHFEDNLPTTDNKMAASFIQRFYYIKTGTTVTDQLSLLIIQLPLLFSILSPQSLKLIMELLLRTLEFRLFVFHLTRPQQTINSGCGPRGRGRVTKTRGKRTFCTNICLICSSFPCMSRRWSWRFCS